jgi:hypothetical protein
MHAWSQESELSVIYSLHLLLGRLCGVPRGPRRGRRRLLHRLLAHLEALLSGVPQRAGGTIVVVPWHKGRTRRPRHTQATYAACMQEINRETSTSQLEFTHGIPWFVGAARPPELHPRQRRPGAERVQPAVEPRDADGVLDGLGALPDLPRPTSSSLNHLAVDVAGARQRRRQERRHGGHQQREQHHRHGYGRAPLRRSRLPVFGDVAAAAAALVVGRGPGPGVDFGLGHGLRRFRCGDSRLTGDSEINELPGLHGTGTHGETWLSPSSFN